MQKKTEKIYNPKKFLIYLSILTVLILSVVATVSYYVDPFFQYRIKDNSYLLNPQFVNPGLIRNHDYNTVIIGSSMIQNFDLSIIRKKHPNIKPLKAGLGGMSLDEIELLHSLAKKEQKVESFVINIDFNVFDIKALQRIPAYLCKDELNHKLQYLLAYETFIRYVPVDILLEKYLANPNVDLSPKMKMKTTIDEVGNFSLDAVYNVEKTQREFLEGFSLSFVDPNGLSEAKNLKLRYKTAKRKP